MVKEMRIPETELGAEILESKDVQAALETVSENGHDPSLSGKLEKMLAGGIASGFPSLHELEQMASSANLPLVSALILGGAFFGVLRFAGVKGFENLKYSGTATVLTYVGVKALEIYAQNPEKFDQTIGLVSNGLQGLLNFVGK